MNHDEKVARFLDEMRRRGVNLSTAAPPAWRTAWRLGLRLPPPHFMEFVPLFLVTGTVFGAFWGLAMWFLVWRTMGSIFSATAALTAGVLFGFFMASYYRHSAVRLGLPPWEEYPGASDEQPAGDAAMADD